MSVREGLKDFETVLNDDKVNDVKNVKAIDVDSDRVLGSKSEPIMLGQQSADVVEPPLNPQSIEINELFTKIKSDIIDDDVESIDGLDCIPIARLSHADTTAYQLTSVDDPKDVLDNTKSSIPWHKTGRFESLEEMKEKVNSDYIGMENRDPLDTALGVLKAATIVPAIVTYASKRTTIMKDHFRVAQMRSTFKVFGPGVVSPPLTSFKWISESQPFDLEGTISDLSDIRHITPNHTFIQVGPNCLGVARINSCKTTVADNGEEFGGADGDTVLFAQGKYILRESAYRDIHVIYMNPEKSILPINKLATLIRIDKGQVGGALRLETNEFEIFQPGKTIVLDNKEWSNPMVVDTVQGIFSLGKYVQYISLDEGSLCSISRKDGKQFLLSKPGLYVLRHENWEFAATELKKNDQESFNIGPFVVETIHSDEVGVARNRWTNECWILKSGKYYLHSAKWEVSKCVITNTEVYIKPFTFLAVGESCYVGARNNVRGTFDEFQEVYKNKILVLHESIYSDIVQIPKVSHTISRFGPYYLLTVPAGKVALFDCRGEIRMEGSGEKRMSLKDGIILEPLPLVPQSAKVDNIVFLSSDDYDMSATATLEFKIEDFIKCATNLRSKAYNHTQDEIIEDYIERNTEGNNLVSEKHHGEYKKAWGYTFEDFTMEILYMARKIIVSQLRTYESNQLLINGRKGSQTKEQISENIQNLCEYCETALTKIFSKVGISILSIRLIGGFEFTDSTVKKYFKTRTQENIKAETWSAVAKSNEAVAKADAAKKQVELETLKMVAKSEDQRKLDEAKVEADIVLMNLQAAKEQEAVALENLKLKTQKENEIAKMNFELEQHKQKLQLEYETKLNIEKARAKKEISKLNAEAEALKSLETAKAEAEAIRIVAEAEAVRMEMINEAARKRPQNIDVENIMKIMNEGIDKFSNAAWRYPDVMEGLIGMQKLNNNNNGENTTSSSSSPLTYQTVMQQNVTQAVAMMQILNQQKELID